MDKEEISFATMFGVAGSSQCLARTRMLGSVLRARDA